LWLKLDKFFFHFSRDLYICFLYISPINSCYTKRTNCDKLIFDKLEKDILKYSLLGDISLMGDLNARVKASDQDYITVDMNDVLDDFLPNNYIPDTVHIKLYRNIPKY
jgi:hypothetical protein